MACRFVTVAGLAFACARRLAGCNRPAGPRPPARFVAAGTVRPSQSGKSPCSGRASSARILSGDSSFKDCRVEVYDQFILITFPDGPTILSPHGWYTDLAFRRDPQAQ